MDFVTGLPKTFQGYDPIWVIMDCFTKYAHFLLVKTQYSAKDYVELYLSRIVCLHGITKKIISDQGTHFTSHLWRSLPKAMGTELFYSTTFHPQTEGQIERVNQILEDMLRACALTYRKGGNFACHSQSFLIPIVTNPISKWLCLKLSMEKDVEHL